METQDVTRSLSTLLHLEQAATGVYDAALGKIHDHKLTESMARFRQDHQRHAESLKDLIAAMGGQPGPRFKELEEFNMTALDVTAEAVEQDALLTALRVTEAAYKLQYGMALAGIGGDAAREVKEMLKDEEQHLNFLDVAATAVLKR